MPFSGKLLSLLLINKCLNWRFLQYTALSVINCICFSWALYTANINKVSATRVADRHATVGKSKIHQRKWFNLQVFITRILPLQSYHKFNIQPIWCLKWKLISHYANIIYIINIAALWKTFKNQQFHPI